MIFIDVNLMKTLLGENWQLILVALLILAILILLWARAQKGNWLNDAQKRQKTRFDYMNPHVSSTKDNSKQEIPPIYHSQNGEWSPTGWIYDKDKETWIPPDYLEKESAGRWKWDNEKQIWIDLKKAPKKEPNPDCPVKIERNGLSYEEWKNQHYKEVYEKLTEEAERRQQEKNNPRE